MATDKAVVVVVVVAVVGLLCASSPGLSQAADNSDKSGCFRGWTGRNSGGSCSWDNTLCDWERVKEDDLTWELTDTGLVELDFDAYSDPEKGRLRSPLMCEEAGSQLCVEVKFRFGSGGDSQWFLQLCQGAQCTSLLHFAYNEDTNWVVHSAAFIATGQSFRMVILGDKFYNGYFDESTIYIDYIRYNNASCGEKATGVTSLTTSMLPLTSSEQASTTTDSDTVMVVSTSFGGNENENASSALKIDEQGDEGGIPIVIIVGVGAALLVIIVIVVIVVVVVVKRRSRKSAEKDTELAVRYERNDTANTVSNELYNCLPPTTLGGQQQQPRPTPVTSNNGDVTSHSTTPTDYDNINAQFAGSGPGRKSTKPADKHGDAVYDVADDDDDEQKDVYENTEPCAGGEEDKEVYENTALRHHAEPAAASTEGEYSHLTDRNNRPDRRCDSYDRVK